MTVQQSLTEFPNGLTQGGVYTPTVQDIQNAAADKASYYFNGTATVQTGAKAALNIGSSEATLIYSGTTNSITSSGIKFFAEIFNGTDGVIFDIIRQSGTGLIQCMQGVSTVDTGFSVPAKTPFTVAVTRYNTNKIKAYLNGVADIERAQTLKACTASSDFWVGENLDGTANRAMLFNYALPADKIQRYSDGAKLDWEDIGGSMALVTGTDSDMSGAGNWVAAGSGNFTPNSPTGKGTFAVTGTSTVYIGLANKLVIGKRYRVSVKLRFVSGTNQTLYVGNLNNQDNYLGFDATGTEATYSGEFTARYTSFYIGRANPSGFTANATYEIDDVQLTQLGAVLDLEPEGIYADKWIDSSNGLHGTVTGAVVSNSNKLERVQGTLSNGANFSGTTPLNSGTIALPTGRWMIFGKSYFATSVSAISSVSTSLSSSSVTHNAKSTVFDTSTNTGADKSVSPLPIIVDSTPATSGGTVTFYMVANCTGVTGTVTTNSANSELFALRIA